MTKECTGCHETQLAEAFPLNAGQADGLHSRCLTCHRKASAAAYRARLAREASRKAEAAEAAVWQRWSASCLLCPVQRSYRRRATDKPLSLVPEQLPCACGSTCLLELVTGPVTLGAADAELRRIWDL